MPQPVGHDGQIIVLPEGVEGNPQAEALGERHLLLGGFAGVNLAVVLMAGLQVFREHLGHQVPAVGGSVDQHVVGLAGQRAVQYGLQGLVGTLALLERQVVTVDDETLGAVLDALDDFRQVGELGLVHLDQTQPLVAKGGQARLDQRRFARATRTGEQHVVGRQAADELAGIGLHQPFLLVDILQVFQPQGGRAMDGVQLAHAAERGLATLPAKGAGRPVRLAGHQQRLVQLGQQGFDGIEQTAEARTGIRIGTRH